MARLTRKQLKKLYPLADENYLVAMVEGKVHVANYQIIRKKEIREEFDTVYYPKIENVFVEYLNSKKRDYFLPEDNANMKKMKKQVISIIEEYIAYSTQVFVTSVSEVYNYKRLYNLWMLSKIGGTPEDKYDRPAVVGEADKDDKGGIVDPLFSKSKLDALVNNKSYGRSFADRTSHAIETASNSIDNSMKGVLSGKGKELNQYLKTVEKQLKKDVSSKVANAISLGIEDAEDFGDYDVFSANSFTGNYQRVEILDNRTCLVCAKFDGAVYKEPLGRVHPHCRGIDVPINPAEDKSRIRELSSSAKRKESFNDWFENLEESNKRSLLGKTKYEAYKDGSINVHNLVKQNRVIGAKEVKRIEQLKSIPTLKTDVSVARSVIRNENKKLKRKTVASLKTQDDVNAYYRYISKKEGIYKNLETSALKKAGIHRNTLNAEINRERKVLRLKEKEIALKDKIAQKATT